MKLALLGDVHGNSSALEAMLLSAKRKNVEKLLITGDLVGYYFDPATVMNLLSGWEYFLVKGNHEEMLSRAMQEPDYILEVENKYGPGLRDAIQQLNSMQLEYLTTLPHPLHIEFDRIKITLCHGSSMDFDKYIYPDADNKVYIENNLTESDLVVFGHTHYTVRRIVGNTEYINPGSVGQPRDSNPGAQWALYDTDLRSVEFYCERYDMSELVNRCKHRVPELPYLWQVLMRRKFLNKK